MRPFRVVVLDPRVDPGLGVVDRIEDRVPNKFVLQGAMEPLDLARGRRRARRRQQVSDAVLTTDPIEEHLAGPGPEPAREHFAVVRQDLLPGHRDGASPTPTHHTLAEPSPAPPPTPTHRTESGHRPRSRPSPRTPQPASRHRRCPSATTPSTGCVPTACNPSLPPPRFRRDQPVTDQTPIDRRPPRHRIDPLDAEPMTDRLRAPHRMLHPHRHDPRLGLRRHLMRTRTRRLRPDPPDPPTLGRVPRQPPMHRLPRHPGTRRDLSHRNAVENLQHRCIPLFHKPELHQHDDTPWSTSSTRKHSPSATPRVTHQPEPLSHMNRTRAETCNASTGAALSSMNRDSTSQNVGSMLESSAGHSEHSFPYQAFSQVTVGAPDRIRTCGLVIRSDLLCPAELQGRPDSSNGNLLADSSYKQLRLRSPSRGRPMSTPPG